MCHQNGGAEEWGVSSDFEVQPIEVTVALISALSGNPVTVSTPWIFLWLNFGRLQTGCRTLTVSPVLFSATSACDGWRIPELGEWMLAARQSNMDSRGPISRDIVWAHQGGAVCAKRMGNLT